ncbi:MAG: PH domain-containing protein [Clostridia bacterium]|nr:PH domain-containing protein [Clostridia bacterium]
MEFKKLDKKAKLYWFIMHAIWAIIILVVLSVSIFLTGEVYLLPLIIGVGVPATLLSIFLIIYPFLKYRFYSYAYNEEKVVIRYGVIFRHTIVMPICQIQDLHVYQGPIMSLFKLSGIIFSTAGSNFELRCLDKKIAEKIVTETEIFLKKRLEEKANEEI